MPSATTNAEDYPHVIKFEHTTLPEPPKFNDADATADAWDEIGGEDSGSTICDSLVEEQAPSEPVQERVSHPSHS